MKPTPMQPEWLHNMIYGYAGYEKWRLLIDGVNFAIVQIPGGGYQSGRDWKYGTTSYYLVDKRSDPRTGHGMQYWQELKDGGRIGKKILADWKALVDASDKLDAFADPETKQILLENFVDNLAVYLATTRKECDERWKGVQTDLNRSKDWWGGHVNALDAVRVKLKQLVPTLIEDEKTSN